MLATSSHALAQGTSSGATSLRNPSHNPPTHPPIIARLSGVAVKADDTTESRLLDYTGSRLVEVRDTCVYHAIMNQPLNVEHNRLYGWCSSTLRNGDQFYDTYRQKFWYTTRCCWRCGAPHWGSFKHSQKGGCTEEGLQDWLRAIPYLIWRTSALRLVIFPRLGIPQDAFDSISSFKRWLGLQAGPAMGLTSNLIVLVWAYFQLLEQNALPNTPLRMDGEFCHISS